MEFVKTSIPDVVLIKPDVFADPRGFLMETWQRRKFAEAGIDVDFVQDNHSLSTRGTLRGLHYQVQQPQGKLVRVILGEVFDVALDIRKKSSTFGRWVGVRLSAENKSMLWVPAGFAHGFYVISDVAELQYKCTDYYAPGYERCIRWNDPVVDIAWPLMEGTAPLLSKRDQAGQEFKAAATF